MASALAAGSAFLLVSLRKPADHNVLVESYARELANEMDQYYTLSVATAPVIPPQAPGHGVPTEAPAVSDQRPNTQGSMIAKQAELTTRRLRELAGSSPRVEKIIQDLQAGSAALGSTQLSKKSPAQVVALLRGLGVSSARTGRELHQLAEDAHAKAVSARHRANIATGLILGLCALMIALLLWRFDRFRVRSQARLVEELHEHATHDALTGLGNRRALEETLGSWWATHGDHSKLWVLLFDLNGFKIYNDTFGHPAGDLLLQRLGTNLGIAAAPHGRAYRLGGDEFCVTIESGRDEVLLQRCMDALSDRGVGFEVTTSVGSVLVPEEAESFEVAFQLADDRLYSHKGGRGRDAGGQVRDIVLSLVNEVQPSLRLDAARVARLARAVGLGMGIDGPELEDVVRCAELHDIGKTAIPAAILDKPGPLSDDEWNLMRRHTTIAERVLLAAPALAGAAALARSSYEHYDGSGYPDGLTGEQIPLGSRIAYVCRAYDAMLRERPFQAAVDEAEALRRLRDGAGTQFDPKVVELFAAALESAPRSGRQAA